MAGSFNHVSPFKRHYDDGSSEQLAGRWSFIENMGDAYECVEELLYLVLCFADEKDIQEALEDFYKFQCKDKDPAELHETDYGKFQSDNGVAYQQMRKVMDCEDEE